MNENYVGMFSYCYFHLTFPLKTLFLFYLSRSLHIHVVIIFIYQFTSILSDLDKSSMVYMHHFVFVEFLLLLSLLCPLELVFRDRDVGMQYYL